MDLKYLSDLGINTDEGLAFCADDPEFYEEMLGEYVAEGQERIPKLRLLYSEQDWANYQIQAHSAKNTSRMIGASHLSEKAFALEIAAKNRDTAAIRSAHEFFLDEYGTLVGKLSELLV